MSSLPLRPTLVPPQRVGDLLERLPGSGLDGDPATTVTGVTHDSRQVHPGDLYIARAGASSHGIEHVSAAAGAGAVAVLTDRASAPRARIEGVQAVVIVDDPRSAMGATAAWVYADPARSLQIFGVTGTNGKTTTAHLLDAGLRTAGRQTALIGTIETRVGDETVSSARTTPEATDLQALFAVMRERGVGSVAMEVSSHALALGRVDGTAFDVAAFTNLSQDHLDFHPDMADYFAAKARLFTSDFSRQAVICIDDEWGRRLARDTEIAVTTVGADPASQWRRATEAEGRTTLTDPSGATIELTTHLVGRVNLSNAALAYVTLVVAGVEPEAARAGIAALPGIPGRMERVDAGQPFVVLVDYAHTPDGLTSALEDAQRMASARVVVVVGCGGDRDRAKRPLMGAAAAAGADIAVFTSDNPRSEDPEEIIAAMLTGVAAGEAVITQVDRRHAIGEAMSMARAGDVVLIAGKGHETGQETAGQVVPFDDRLVAREAITALGSGAG